MLPLQHLPSLHKQARTTAKNASVASTARIKQALFSTEKGCKWDAFTYMTIQCQTWLAPDAAILKRKEEKKSGRQSERMREGMRLLHSRGHEARQCSPGYPSCQILLSPPLLCSTPQTALPRNRREGPSTGSKKQEPLL